MKTLFQFTKGLGLFISLGLFAITASAQTEADPAKDMDAAMRILCITVLPDGNDIMVATKDEQEQWVMLSEKVSIRTNFVSEWIPAARGTCYLVKKTGEVIESLGSFTYPSGSSRVVIVLLANKSANNYRIDLVDPESLGFSEGKALVANYSSQTAVAKLGDAMIKVESGNKKVIEPIPEDNGMYRMTLGYLDSSGKAMPCYDRYVDYSERSRDFLLLFPDRRQPGFTVFSLAEFGPFE